MNSDNYVVGTKNQLYTEVLILKLNFHKNEIVAQPYSL